MIAGLLLGHGAVCLALALAGRRLGRRSLLIAAAPPAAATIWGVSRLGVDEPAQAHLVWAEGLDLAMTFRVDDFVEIMTLIVSGIGVAVFVYAYGYFTDDDGSVGRFAATLLAFSTAMLGLVWSDSVWSLFVFWEMTSVTSFLLVGHKNTDPGALVAARRALMVTGGGGLALLAGLLLVSHAADATLLSEIGPTEGASATVGAVLVMLAAATKSAQVPFHAWLPGAMVAPTPVSAYLHSATMVKAGVVLVAVLGPVLGALDAWKTLGLAFGIVSIVWGAVGALRQRDAKLILAWGTVSQLGLLITLFCVGTPKATLAAVTLLVSHALFKGALFLIVGEVDVRAGTRDIDQLGGLARSMPGACAAALLAGLSMAGVPPLLGFVAKETAIEATLALAGIELWLVGAGVIGGSVLTVAYTVRLLAGMFGSGPATPLRPHRSGLAAPSRVLALAGVAGYFALGPLEELVGPAAERLAADSVGHLHQWPGLTLGFWVSVAVLTLGAAGGMAAGRRLPSVPKGHAARLTDAVIDSTLVSGRELCARLQHGSLPVYLVTMATTVALAAVPFAVHLASDSDSFDHLIWWHSPLQAVVALAAVAASLGLAAVGTRLGAGLALGATGLSLAALFVIHGAADLALTQLLVEAAIVVGFVLAFGHLSRRFPQVGLRWRAVRMAVAGLGGAAVVAGLVAASHEPVAEPPLDEMATQAAEQGGGNNVVNVILTDIRALDTLGEVFVLAVVALGVLALARASRHGGSVHEADEVGEVGEVCETAGTDEAARGVAVARAAGAGDGSR
ncbi:MAG: proton-conducting transporter membrane subunit [Acidimicrobiaceae bacterium]|nr:proton-conducting transporter membrane subunit [Acidimicrobiaceae bacterium]